MAFKASPSSQHQHCTDKAQKAETVLSAVNYIDIYFFYKIINFVKFSLYITMMLAIMISLRNVQTVTLVC